MTSEGETCMARVRKAGIDLHGTENSFLIQKDHEAKKKKKKNQVPFASSNDSATHMPSSLLRFLTRPLACPLSYPKVGLSYHCTTTGQVRLLNGGRFLLLPLFL